MTIPFTVIKLLRRVGSCNACLFDIVFSFTMANIALPGTSSFVGEFLLLLGIFKMNIVAAVLEL